MAQGLKENRGHRATGWRMRWAASKWLLIYICTSLALLFIAIGVATDFQTVYIVLGALLLGIVAAMLFRAGWALDHLVRETATQARKISILRADIRQQRPARESHSSQTYEALRRDIEVLARDTSAVQGLIAQQGQLISRMVRPADQVSPAVAPPLAAASLGVQETHSAKDKYGASWAVERGFLLGDSSPLQKVGGPRTDRDRTINTLRAELHVSSSLHEMLTGVLQTDFQDAGVDVVIISDVGSGYASTSSLDDLTKFARRKKALHGAHVPAIFWAETTTLTGEVAEYLSSIFDVLVSSEPQSDGGASPHLVCRELLDLRAIEKMAVRSRVLVEARSLGAPAATEEDGAPEPPGYVGAFAPLQQQLAHYARREATSIGSGTELLAQQLAGSLGIGHERDRRLSDDVTRLMDDAAVYPTAVFLQKLGFAAGMLETPTIPVTVVVTVKSQREAAVATEHVADCGNQSVARLVLVVARDVPSHLIGVYARIFTNQRVVVTSERMLVDSTYQEGNLLKGPYAIVCTVDTLPSVAWIRRAVTLAEGSVLPVASSGRRAGLSIERVSETAILMSADAALRQLQKPDATMPVRVFS